MKNGSQASFGDGYLGTKFSESVMTGHLTLFLACFSVIFSRFYQQNGGFVMFSIFESVILLFPKHSNFMVFLM